MSTTREAAIRATLNTAGFIGGLRQMGDATKSYGRAASKALKEGLAEGAREGQRVLRESGARVKELLTTGATLGGAFSFEESIKGAVEMNSKFRQIAYAVTDATGEATSWQEVQEKIEGSATATHNAIGGVADAFELVRQKTNNVRFAEESMDSVGKFATATRLDLNLVGGAAASLQQKFGATAEAVPKMLAEILKAGKGNAGFQEIAPQIDRIGAISMEAGLKGERGFKFFLGVLAATRGPLQDTEAQISGIDGVLGNLQKDVKLDAIAKALAPAAPKKFANEIKGAKDSLEAFKMILAKKGGADQLKEAFGKQKDTRETLKILLEPYLQAAGKGATKEDRQKGIDAFDKSMDALGKSAESNADMAERFKQEADTADSKFRDAMNKIERSFGDPKMIAAVDKFAENLPKLADTVAKFAEFAGNHPLAGAAGAVVGPTLISGFAAAAATVIGKTLTGTIKEVLADRAADVAEEAAAKTAGGALAGGLSVFGGGAAAAGTAAAAAGAEGAAVAGTGAAAVAGTGALALGGLATAAVAAWGAAIYQGVQLKDENEASGGIWKNLKEAWEGKTAKATSGADYDKIYAKGTIPNRGSRGASTPQEVSIPDVQITSAVEGVKKHGRESDRTAASLARLATTADSLNRTLAGLVSGGGTGGAERGPGRLPPARPGSGALPPNR